jgi:hypothetical protein
MFEALVRPFETPQPLAKSRIAAVVASGDPPGPAVLAWGAAGAVPAGAPLPPERDPYEDVSFDIECCKDQFEQKARKTETVRVYGKDDPNQTGPFIEVQRPIELGFTKLENECSAKTPDIVIAPIEGLFTPNGQPVYSVTDNRAKKHCENSFKYKYGDEAAA